MERPLAVNICVWQDALVWRDAVRELSSQSVDVAVFRGFMYPGSIVGHCRIQVLLTDMTCVERRDKKGDRRVLSPYPVVLRERAAYS